MKFYTPNFKPDLRDRKEISSPRYQFGGYGYILIERTQNPPAISFYSECT